MDQEIEAAGVRVAIQNCQKLQLVELYQLLNGLAEGFKQALGIIAMPYGWPAHCFSRILHTPRTLVACLRLLLEQPKARFAGPFGPFSCST